MRLIRAEKKRRHLCFQTELAEENHFTHRSYRGEHNKSTSRKKKILTPNAIKKFYMQARTHPEIFWQTQARSEKPGLTYITTLHHVKRFILRVLLYLQNDTKIYLRLNQNAQPWIGKKVPSFTFNTKRMFNKARCVVLLKQMFRTWMKTLLHCGFC